MALTILGVFKTCDMVDILTYFQFLPYTLIWVSPFVALLGHI